VSAAAREYEARIARVVIDAGAQIIARGTDGSGHRTVTLRLRNHERTFHYPSTGTVRGCGLRNTQQRLKNLLKEIPEDTTPVSTLEELPAPVNSIIAAPRVSTPPNTRRLTKGRRSAIVKHYQAASSIECTMTAFELSHTTVSSILLATAGNIRTKYERERHERRSSCPRTRDGQKTHSRIPATRAKTTPAAVKKPPHKLTPAAEKKRASRICIYHHYGMTAGEISKLMTLPIREVREIVKANPVKN